MTNVVVESQNLKDAGGTGIVFSIEDDSDVIEFNLNNENVIFDDIVGKAVEKVDESKSKIDLTMSTTEDDPTEYELAPNSMA